MKGCLLRFLFLPLIIAVLYVVFSLRAPFPTFVFPAEGAEIPAFVSGILLWFALISWLDARQIASSLDAARSWSVTDGFTTIAGRIAAEGPPLEAPLSGEECLAYLYRVKRYSPGSGGMTARWWDVYEGYAMTPSILRGQVRSARILAAPSTELFHEVPARQLDGDESFSRAEAYIDATDFGEKPPGRLATTRRKEQHRGPGDFRVDLAVDDESTGIRDCRLEERIIRAGDEILVAGVYSAEHGGIEPDPDQIMRPYHLVSGGEAPLRRKIRNRRKGMAVTVVLALIVAAIYYLAFVSL